MFFFIDSAIGNKALESKNPQISITYTTNTFLFIDDDTKLYKIICIIICLLARF